MDVIAHPSWPLGITQWLTVFIIPRVASWCKNCTCTLQSNWSVPNISSPGRYQYAKRWALCALFVDEGRLKINLLMNHKSSDNLGLNQPRQRKCIFSSWNCVQTRLPCAYLEIDIPRLVSSTTSHSRASRKLDKEEEGQLSLSLPKRKSGQSSFRSCVYLYFLLYLYLSLLWAKQRARLAGKEEACQSSCWASRKKLGWHRNSAPSSVAAHHHHLHHHQASQPIIINNNKLP